MSKGSSKPHLVLFDVDGTLTDTHEVASSAYLRSAKKHFSLEATDLDWGQYTSSTATGIAQEITQKKWGRKPLENELKGIKEDVLNAVKGASTKAIPGSVETIKHLLNDCHYAVGIATGNFRCVVEHTLNEIGLPEGIPLATADEHIDRAGIITLSIEKAHACLNDTFSNIQSFSAITYIGDGIWDYRAALSLGHDFIGVGSCPKMGGMAGERRVVDFTNCKTFLSLLKAL